PAVAGSRWRPRRRAPLASCAARRGGPRAAWVPARPAQELHVCAAFTQFAPERLSSTPVRKRETPMSAGIIDTQATHTQVNNGRMAVANPLYELLVKEVLPEL